MRLVVLPGDGIGPEISAATYDILELLNKRMGLEISFETHEIGLARLKKDRSTFPPSVAEACRSGRAIQHQRYKFASEAVDCFAILPAYTDADLHFRRIRIGWRG